MQPTVELMQVKHCSNVFVNVLGLAGMELTVFIAAPVVLCLDLWLNRC